MNELDLRLRRRSHPQAHTTVPFTGSGRLLVVDSHLDPDAIAQGYMHVVDQHRSAWTWDIELRPWVERL